MRFCLSAVMLFLSVVAFTGSIRAQAVPDYGRFLSGFSPSVVESLREIAARNERMHDDAFTRIGDSATVNWGFIRCFGMDHLELAEHGSLRETVDFFRHRGRMFRRDSLAAGVGWSSPRVFSGGRRAPLYEELRAIRPRYALIHFGGNDIQGANLARYTHWMWKIVERLAERGVIPVLTTVMPRGDDPEKNAMVPVFNAALRALARTWRIPLIDLHAALLPLPRWGLAGDGQHPNSFAIDGQTRACHFNSEGLQHGNNVRNLISLMMLDRLRRHVALGEEGTGEEPPRVEGEGSRETPYRAPTWPLLHRSEVADTDLSSGREYRFRLEAPKRVVFWLAPRRDVRLTLVLRAVDSDDVQARSGQAVERIDQELGAGDYSLRVMSHRESSGEYVLIGDAVSGGQDPFTEPTQP